MKIKLTLPEHAADYFRHARQEMIRAIGDSIDPELLVPAPFGMYLLAYGNEDDRPLGVAEFAFYDQLYSSFEDSPYPDSIDLAGICTLDSFVGTRTIFVEPEARRQVPPYYLMLSMAGCQLAHRLGARYTTASTNANDRYLMRLYSKTGGRLVGTYYDREQSRSEIAVFVFELTKLTSHAAMKRLQGKFDLNLETVRIIRSRNQHLVHHESTPLLV